MGNITSAEDSDFIFGFVADVFVDGRDDCSVDTSSRNLFTW